MKYVAIPLTLLLAVLLLIGCTSKKAETTDVVVAKINGEPITQADLDFYQFINLIQIEMYRAADQSTYQGEELNQAMKYWDAQAEDAKNPNTLLTQIIRLRAMSLLAEEKGHQATAEEVDKEVAKVKEIYQKQPVAMKMIGEYGEEKFWDQEKAQYERIVLVNKVQQDMIQKVKEANPNADAKEINMLAEKKYEELVVSQMGTLEIEIVQKGK